MKRRGIFTGAVFCASAFLWMAEQVNAENIVFPSNPGVIDVTQPPYNADNTGQTDVADILTQAIRDGHEPNGWAPRIVYLPNGTYMVRNTVRQKEPPFTMGPFIWGQSRKGTVIRLADGTWPEITGLNFVLSTGNGVAQCFDRGVRNLTVSIGRNNAGASGIWWYGNNAAMLSDVDVISEDGLGVVGLHGGDGESGPSMVRNLYVKGFRIGVQVAALNAVTFLNITVEGQSLYGVLNQGNPAWFDLLTSINEVTAVRNQNGGKMVLVGATLTGGNATADAIANESGSRIFVRNIQSEGYRRAISCPSTNLPGDQLPTGVSIDEFSSHGSTSQFASSSRSLNLPRKLPPQLDWEQDLAKWADVSDYMSGRSDEQALQAAIDDLSKTTVAITNSLTLNGTIYIRNNIKHIIGIGITLFTDNGCDLVVDEGTAPFVQIDELSELPDEYRIRIVQRSSRPVNIQSGQISVSGEGSGDIFIADMPGVLEVSDPRQHVWTWHFNGERWMDGREIVMSAGVVRCFGWKSEHEETKVIATGGTLEMLGFHMYSPRDDGLPLLDISNTNFSAAMVSQIGRPYNLIVRETKNGETRELTNSNNPDGSDIPLYLSHNLPARAEAPMEYKLPAHAQGSRRFVHQPGSPSFAPKPSESGTALRFVDTRGRIVEQGGGTGASVPGGVYYLMMSGAGKARQQ